MKSNAKVAEAAKKRGFRGRAALRHSGLPEQRVLSPEDLNFRCSKELCLLFGGAKLLSLRKDNVRHNF